MTDGASRRGGARGRGLGVPLRVPLGATLATVALLPSLALAAPSPTPVTDDAPVEVTVAKLAPRFLSDPDAFLQVAGTVRNTGTQPVRRLELRLMVGERLQSRGDLAQADEEPPALRPVATAVVPDDDELTPGETQRFDIRLRVARLGFGQLGAYPFGVRARGVVDDGGSREQLGLVQTYLPWFPEGPPQPTRIAWVWPLTDRPTRAPREVVVDESLPASLDSGGRLSQLVVGAQSGGQGKCDDVAEAPPDATVTSPPPRCTAPVQVPVTYAVDPDLLFGAEALTRPWDLLVDGGRETRPASTAARGWLGSLREDLGLARTDLVVLPYADPDVVALTRDADLDVDVATARTLGATVAQQVLGQTSVLDVAWPPAGPLPQAALEASLGPQTSAVLLDETALPPPPVPPDYAPDARVELTSTVSRDVTGLVIDDALSQLLVPGPATSGKGPRLAEQRWLVETAMIVAERPSLSRTLVVAPPRRGTVPQAVAAAVIADTGRVPWLCPVSLRDVVAGRDACPGASAPSEPREPETTGTVEAGVAAGPLVSQDYLRALAAVRRDAEQLTDAVLDPGEAATSTKQRLLRARLRAESSAWRDAPAQARQLLALLQEDVKSLREQVTLRANKKVTLTSDKGTIRVNLQNATRQPVTVRVRLSAPAARLSVETSPEVTLLPESVQQLDLEVEALVSGQFVVEAQLLDREMRPFGDSTRIVVRSTRYGRLALALTGLGAAGLLVAAGVRIARRALRPTRPTDPGTDPSADLA